MPKAYNGYGINFLEGRMVVIIEGGGGIVVYHDGIYLGCIHNGPSIL